MKRETRRWLEASAGCDHVRYNCKEANCAGTFASDALDSDARQRAEIRDLKKRLKLAERAVGMELVHGHSSWEGSPEQVIVRAAVAACDLKKPLKEKR